MFHDSNWRRDFLAAAGIIGSDSSSSGPTRAEQLELEVESPKTAFDNYTAYMDRAIAQDKLSWPKQRSAPPIPIPTDYVNQMLLPVFAQARFKQYGTFAENRLFETQLALRAYLLDHGRYPATLDELIPGYLPSLPIDPFTDGAPLKYRTTSSGYLLYSVGPDTIDNGGTPIFDGTMSDGTPNYSALTTADEKGDIVAGISR
jgi:type II secretory pathway pseudopilin PulG